MLKLEKLYSENSPYKCVFINGQTGESVRVVLTDGIAIDTQSSWQDVTEKTAGTAGVAYLWQKATDRSTMMHSFTKQVWRGSEIPVFSFAFARVAIKNTKIEIVKEAKMLLSWPYPPEPANPMKPPVLSTGNSFITVRVGSWLEIKNLVPVSCNITFDPILDKTNKSPIKYTGTLSLKCDMQPTRFDVLGWFKD